MTENYGPGSSPGEWAPTPTPAPPDGSAVGPAAEWWKRLLAILLDGLVLGVPLTVFLAATGLSEFKAVDGRFSAETSGLGLLISFAAPLVYSAILEGGPRGQGVGKMALGIRVVDAQTGDAIGPGRAALRRLVYAALFYALVVPGIINGLSPLWDKRRQAWHDKAVSSVVVIVPR